MALPGLLQRRRQALAAARLPDMAARLNALRDRVRERGVRLTLALPGLVSARRSEMDLMGHRLAGALRQAVGVVHARANRLLGRMTDASVRARLREGSARLEGLGGRLEAVSPLAVLARGYALVSDSAGHPLTQAASVKPGARLSLRFADGEVKATADGRRGPDRQGSLPL